MCGHVTRNIVLQSSSCDATTLAADAFFYCSILQRVLQKTSLFYVPLLVLIADTDFFHLFLIYYSINIVPQSRRNTLLPFEMVKLKFFNFPVVQSRPRTRVVEGSSE